MSPPLPVGFRLLRDESTRRSDEGRVLDGGTPWRMLRLTASGADLARPLLDGVAVGGVADGMLARRFVDAGLAHPVPPRADPAALTVVVPVRDRADALAGCLTALSSLPVVVVDDGSRDPGAVATVAAEHAADVVRRPSAGGPAAARNTGLVTADAELVAFVDSDCFVDAATLRALAAHFADPCVAAVAPQVQPRVAGASPGLPAFACSRSPLDMGPRPASVRPGGRVSYVPSTALLLRRDVLTAVGGFDEALRYGEDVDLCWRLHDAGWAIRYDPTCSAQHDEPTTWSGWLSRRFRYGTSAGPLAVRHPGALRGPSLRGLVAPARLLGGGTDDGTGVPADVLRRVARRAPAATASGLLRWAAPVWFPPLAAATAPPAMALSAVADSAAYGAGVWAGCLRERTVEPLLPAFSARPRTTSP